MLLILIILWLIQSCPGWNGGGGSGKVVFVSSWSCGAPSWTAGDCQFQSGKYGLATSTSGAWTGTTNSNVGCDSRFHLYCFEQ